MSKKRPPKSKPDPVAEPQRPDGYWHRAQQPLPSLIFLLPILAAYEVGALIYTTHYDTGIRDEVYARKLLRDFMLFVGDLLHGWLGDSVNLHDFLLLPSLVVIGVLLVWHLADRNGRWKFEPWVYFGMAMESVILAVPLFLFMLVLGQHLWNIVPVSLAGAEDQATWQARLVISLGAGVYEELLFRLFAIAVLHFLFKRILELPDAAWLSLTIGLSAILFALYHYPFASGAQIIMYTFGGVYLAAVYALRGFGVAVGVHAFYDILVVMFFAR